MKPKRTALFAARPRAWLAAVLLATVSIVCSSMRPIVYANDKYKQVGQAGANRDNHRMRGPRRGQAFR